MRHFISLVPVFALLTGCVSGPWKDFYNEPHSGRIPSDVRKFVIAAQGCAHFAGEEGYDAERAAFLKKNTDKLCTGLEAKRDFLRKHYAGNSEVVGLIADTWTLLGDE
jgi:hypothetical protein